MNDKIHFIEETYERRSESTFDKLINFERACIYIYIRGDITKTLLTQILLRNKGTVHRGVIITQSNIRDEAILKRTS